MKITNNQTKTNKYRAKKWIGSSWSLWAVDCLVTERNMRFTRSGIKKKSVVSVEGVGDGTRPGSTCEEGSPSARSFVRQGPVKTHHDHSLCRYGGVLQEQCLFYTIYIYISMHMSKRVYVHGTPKTELRSACPDSVTTRFQEIFPFPG